LLKVIGKYVWPLAIVISLSTHLFVYNIGSFLDALRKEPERIKVPVTVRVLPKTAKLRKGRLDGSFKPKPKEKKPKAKPKPKPKPKPKGPTIPTKNPKPAEPDESQESEVDQQVEEIEGASDEAFGVPDGVEDGEVGVYEEVDLSSDPILIRETFQLPEYTDDALDADFEGTVIVEVFVRKDGSVGDAELAKKVGYGMDRRIVDSVRNARFLPRKDSKGKPLDAWTDLPIRFVIP